MPMSEKIRMIGSVTPMGLLGTGDSHPKYAAMMTAMMSGANCGSAHQSCTAESAIGNTLVPLT